MFHHIPLPGRTWCPAAESVVWREPSDYLVNLKLLSSFCLRSCLSWVSLHLLLSKAGCKGLATFVQHVTLWWVSLTLELPAKLTKALPTCIINQFLSLFSPVSSQFPSLVLTSTICLVLKALLQTLLPENLTYESTGSGLRKQVRWWCGFGDGLLSTWLTGVPATGGRCCTEGLWLKALTFHGGGLGGNIVDGNELATTIH